MENQEIEKIKEYYKLPEKEYNKMYEQARKIAFFDAESYEKPVAILIGGQTGAGKGGIDVFSTKEFELQGKKSIVIDDDGYRMLHPKAREILEKYPTIFTDITAQETNTITRDILQEAIDKRYNFIFEGTMKNTRILETMKNMPKEYTKIVRVMATSKIESLLTAFERNEEQVNFIGYGRFTKAEVHNKTYTGVLNTVKEIEESGVPEVIEIFARTADITNPKKVYSSIEKNNQFNLAYETLKKYREINKEEVKNTAIIRMNNIINNNRKINEDEIKQRALLKELIYEEIK